jgi:hypothetical protein
VRRFFCLNSPFLYLEVFFYFGPLKVAKREIFDHSDFHDFYAIKSLTVSDDFGVKIKICLKNI